MIRVFADSTITLPPSAPESAAVSVLPLFVRYGGQEFVESTMDVDAFYAKIGEMVGNPPTSSQPSAATVEEAFEEAACAGDDVLGVFISSQMSGTLDGALRAARAVAARHAGFRYAFVDSTSNSGDAWPAVREAVQSVEAGHSLAHSAQRALFGVRSSRFLFAPNSLAFLKAGGRIGRASALVGGLMKICPVLTVGDGAVNVRAKVRSHKKALDRILSFAADDVRDHGGLKQLIVHYIGDKAPAVAWAKTCVEPRFGVSVPVLPVSPVIGCHVGPALGIAYQCGDPLPGKITGNIQDYLFTS